jgi:hypothetical protein
MHFQIAMQAAFCSCPPQRSLVAAWSKAQDCKKDPRNQPEEVVASERANLSSHSPRSGSARPHRRDIMRDPLAVPSERRPVRPLAVPTGARSTPLNESNDEQITFVAATGNPACRPVF